MDKLLIICGPTATGKTSLGFYLAKKFDGEIVSADSRQVYQGMDIGTGKDIEKGKWTEGHWEIKGIPLWLVDVVKPNQEFTVADYIELAQKTIKDIWRRKRLPIIVGGTGFYIKGLIDGIETLGFEPDWELRMRLEDLPAQKLFDFLARLDPNKAGSMNVSDRQNPRRLIRQIEIASQGQKKGKQEKLKVKSLLFIGLKTPFKKLYQRIDKRVEERVRKGAEKEARELIKKGYSWDLPAMSAMGYREWRAFFENRVTKAEVIQKWKFDEHSYARKQMTWFKKDERINWFEISQPDFKKRVEKLVKSWYTDSNAKQN